MRGHIYYHCPCFDGMVSAALLADFLVDRASWSEVALVGVNYHEKHDWLARRLDRPAAVVDFLYHPHADHWADHHVTTFLSEAARADFEKPEDEKRKDEPGQDERKPKVRVYDQGAHSCAGVLWRHLESEHCFRLDRYEEAVRWADKIDSAAYDSVEEAVRGDAPALRIAKSLGLGDKDGYVNRLVVVNPGCTNKPVVDRHQRDANRCC